MIAKGAIIYLIRFKYNFTKYIQEHFELAHHPTNTNTTMSRIRPLYYPPSVHPTVVGCSWHEESQWLRRFFKGLLLTGNRHPHNSHRPHNNSHRQQRQQLEDHIWKSTEVHLLQALISLILMAVFAITSAESSHSLVSSFCMYFGQFGLIYDNGINALGKYMGQGDTLRKFSKPRFGLHAVGIPLLGYCITEVATAHGIYGQDSSSTITSGPAIQTMLLVYAVYEIFHWSRYDINDLQLVDLRASTQHEGNYMSGTLAYTTSDNKKLELVLPVVLLVGYELVIGLLLLWRQDSSTCSISGVGLVSSSTITLMTCSIPSRPDIQLFGENFHNSMIGAVLALI